MSRSKEDDFSPLVVAAVEDALSVLGDGAKYSVLFWLEKKYNVGLNDVIVAPRKFTEALEMMFGSGADYIERQILEKLYSTLKLKYREKAGHSFDDYIEGARRQWSANAVVTRKRRR